MPIPPDYAERVYAGVLGKLVGAYVGRPFEQWTHEQIEEREYGEPHELSLRVTGSRLVATVDGEVELEADDGALAGGAVALVCEVGCLTCDAVRVTP